MMPHEINYYLAQRFIDEALCNIFNKYWTYKRWNIH